MTDAEFVDQLRQRQHDRDRGPINPNLIGRAAAYTPTFCEIERNVTEFERRAADRRSLIVRKF